MIQLVSVKVGTSTFNTSNPIDNVPNDQPFQLTFTSPVDTNSARKAISLSIANGNSVFCSFIYSNNFTSLSLTTKSVLQYSTHYVLTISSGLRGINGETFPGVEFHFTTLAESMVITSITLNGERMTNIPLQNIDPKEIKILISFSQALDPSNYKSFFSFTGPPLLFSISADNKSIQASSLTKAKGLTRYLFSISSSLTSAGGFTFGGFSSDFYTGIDSTYQFSQIADNDLLTLVQEQTYKYFWDFGHPLCGMARERNTSGDIVTTGGSGFGIMAMIVAIEKGFISREDGISRLDKILTFLETCDRFHGVWPHWLNGVTGKTQPFSATDNGGDLVETSYMMQGLLAMRQYLDTAVSVENTQIKRINALFSSVEFDWFTNGEKTLYWTWSPDFGYNLKIRGYNETLITYIIAASSPSHSISADTYTIGYANNGSIKNGRSFYGYILPLGPDYGGPLFFTQYSFLGLDPRNLKDQFADYWEQNVNQSLINWSYCLANPEKYPGYGAGIWGLSASDNPWGYSAQSPSNDLGVVTPTAAISSIAYTPVQSMNALKTDYYFLGDRLWGDYGFYDAFDVTEGWWASSTLAIDQGPIICMIENYRTGLLWRLFMSATEVQGGLRKLGFSF
ncbi:MAG: glucoamylase family protein [Bacteroidota bacterium]|nr:glucoamylase family protein [Bacteroidota bacterium]